ncbi:MAG: hypothetical protein VB085_13455 [Peptococcaceae bacterium]|nr:hypothetical protein [Peptococcaceae bacterium]
MKVNNPVYADMEAVVAMLSALTSKVNNLEASVGAVRESVEPANLHEISSFTSVAANTYLGSFVPDKSGSYVFLITWTTTIGGSGARAYFYCNTSLDGTFATDDPGTKMILSDVAPGTVLNDNVMIATRTFAVNSASTPGKTNKAVAYLFKGSVFGIFVDSAATNVTVKVGYVEV